MLERLALQSHPDGSLLPVRARAGGKQRGVIGVQGGALKVAVNQPPEHGKANRAIVALLAETLGVRRQQIELLTGATHVEKRYLVRSLSVDELQGRIAKLLE